VTSPFIFGLFIRVKIIFERDEEIKWIEATQEVINHDPHIGEVSLYCNFGEIKPDVSKFMVALLGEKFYIFSNDL
jgi:hypothetical protein